MPQRRKTRLYISLSIKPDISPAISFFPAATCPTIAIVEPMETIPLLPQIG
jgi:hypothetical protein